MKKQRETKEEEKATHRSRLGLGNQVTAQDGGFDGSLLDGRGLFETVGVDTTEELLGKLHAIERVDSLVPVGVDVGIGEPARWGFFSPFGRRRWLAAFTNNDRA